MKRPILITDQEERPPGWESHPYNDLNLFYDPKQISMDDVVDLIEKSVRATSRSTAVQRWRIDTQIPFSKPYFDICQELTKMPS